MQRREEIHARFAAKFHTADAPVPLSEEQLDAIESTLATKFPASYRSFVTTLGTVYTPQILDEISGRELDHTDVQEFLGSQELIDANQGYWAAGMPNEIIGIAQTAWAT